ncbi:MAG: hypothetical protein JO290_02275 [Sphingomonadaceae bacterium]|nr:hypothetical protein [Sphingomonadaceae bacterium]
MLTTPGVLTIHAVLTTHGVMLAKASVHGGARRPAGVLARPWMLACASMTGPKKS